MPAHADGKPPSDGRPPTQWVGELFAQLESPLIAYVQRRIGNSETAQDIVQEAFVRLCQQDWPQIESYATAWLYQTCRNRAIDILRREGRMSAIHTGTDVSKLHDQSGSEPEKHASDCEQISIMKTQIENLPEQQQEVLRLRLHDGLSYKQIAQVTGLTATNVGYLLHKAVSSLRIRMQVE